MKKQIIKAGVKNLKQYGYKDVDENNILTDYIFSQFFKSMLEDNLGKGADNAIKELLAEIENAP